MVTAVGADTTEPPVYSHTTQYLLSAYCVLGTISHTEPVDEPMGSDMLVANKDAQKTMLHAELREGLGRMSRWGEEGASRWGRAMRAGTQTLHPRCRVCWEYSPGLLQRQSGGTRRELEERLQVGRARLHLL